MFTLRLIEAFCIQTVSCNVFKQRKRSAIHCLQPESVISTTAEMETMPSMQTQFISNLLSLSLLGRQENVGLGVILGQEIAKDQIIPYSCRKPTQNLHRKQRKSSEITILWEIIVTSISIWRLGMHRSAVTVFWTVLWFYER